ncbi:ABC transporter permease [Pinirhizobacter soli]|uniref:ABC transporter permease n=1 Tax=Pinirhizobacter soli TaxID=2786953 RepID=UPI00202AB354|nr:FtsX-like permease family protein [Pinirhizobacter soli]
MLHIKPILSALKRHKVGTLLIGCQIALTLAIICNALSIVHQRITHLNRPSGVVESNLLVIRNDWSDAVGAAIAPLIRTDLSTLRQLPGVQVAGISYGYPLRGGGWNSAISTKPNDTSESLVGSRMFADDQVLPALGATLVAGRNFRADEVKMTDSHTIGAPAVIILTQSLAAKLYPDRSALGKPVYVGDSPTPSTVIGIVRYLAGVSAGSWADSTYDYVMLEPTVLMDKGNAYLVRSKEGQLDALAKAGPAALFKANPQRIIPSGKGEDAGVRTFSEVRAQGYKGDRGLAIMMTAMSAILLVITAAGIVGLTSFWVAQRRKQIGVRRALGATRHDIVSYFLTENFLISAGGLAVGAVLALLLSQWLVARFEMHQLSALYLLYGAMTVMLLGQAATLVPALRASRVSPVEATRSG